MIQGSDENAMTATPVQAFVTMPSLPLDQIICGDNCDVLGTFPRDCIDLVVTSPPYDDLRTYGNHAWDFYGVAWQLKRVLKPGGVIVWVVNDATVDGTETGTSMRQALHFKSIGLRLHDTMIYAKDAGPFPETNRYYPSFEYMLILSKGKPSTTNLIADKVNNRAGEQGGHSQREADGSIQPSSKRKHGGVHIVKEFGVRRNVWEYSPGYGKSTADKVAYDHPAIFPEALARDHILSWSNEGDVVLDPFSGSGTTAKMAMHNGRRFIGIEVNQEYVEISKKRLAQQVLF